MSRETWRQTETNGDGERDRREDTWEIAGGGGDRDRADTQTDMVRISGKRLTMGISELVPDKTISQKMMKHEPNTASLILLHSE